MKREIDEYDITAEREARAIQRLHTMAIEAPQPIRQIKQTRSATPQAPPRKSKKARQ